MARPPISGRRLLSYEDLLARGIRYTRVHLARLEAAGRFPQRVRIGGGNFVAWFEHEIDAYLDGLAAARAKRATSPKPLGTQDTAA
jgi:prophage regulatory protein